MKLRVLLMSLLLAFSLFFSTFSVKPTYAINIGSVIKEIGDLITGIQREQQQSKEINKMSVDHQTVSNVGASVECFIIGCEEAQIAGAIPATGKAMAGVFQNSPASGQTYVADLLQNLKIGPAQPAYAQVGGLGFASLEPVLGAWKQFRNIAYMFFIIITLVVGFMIMMRQKIGGQAAVTAQQAIPNIVIALITVTFSYAVAGFMIDLMYVFMYLLLGLFSAQVGPGDDYVTKNIIEIAGGFILNGGELGNAHQAVGNFVSSALSNTEGGIADAIGWVAGLTFAIIIGFAYLFAVVGLYFELLKTYISIVISIVLSPLLLMLGALPGRSDVFKDWITGLLGNMVAFPVVLLLLILHKLLTSGAAAQGGFLPPYLMGRGSAGAVTTLVGLGVMLIAKDLVVQAKKSVNPKGSGIFEQLGSALSQAVSKGWKGGELIPGAGLTDTNKMPFLGKYIGSGQRVASLGATGLGAGAGGVGNVGGSLLKSTAGVARNWTTGGQKGWAPTNPLLAGKQGFVRGGQLVADTAGYEPFKSPKGKENKK